MVKFTYDIVCRNCSVVQKNSFLTAMNVNENDCVGLTEFDVSLFLEKSFNEGGILCKTCNSENIEVFDIGLEHGGKFYSYDKLASKNKQMEIELLQVLINKKNGKIEFETGGERETNGRFFENALNLIKKVVSTKGEIFQLKDAGSLYVCITGNINVITGQIETIRIERFRTLGLSQEEVVGCINKFLRNHFS